MVDKKINIGIFCDSFFPMVDGVINVVDNYATRLGKYANIIVFVPQGREENYIDNFPYKVVRCKKKIKWQSLDYDLPVPELDENFMKELNKSDLDIVHIHSPFTMGKIGVKYAKEHKIPVVATCHSQFKKDFQKETKSKFLTSIAMDIIMQTFNDCDEVFAVNEGTAKILRNEYKLKAPLSIQYNATDFKEITNKEQAIDEINTLYGIDKDEILFLYVGRMHLLKNILFMCDVMKKLKSKKMKFKMMFVGVGPDTEKLKEKIKECDIENEVIMPGRITDRNHLEKIYTRSNLFIFPSTCDTDGLVKYEAASAKTPVIVIENQTCSSNIIDNVNGYLSKLEADAFADKIYNIFTKEKENYKNVCENCYRDLYITWDKNIEKIYNRYLQIIDSYKQGHYEVLKKFVRTKIAATKKIKAKQKVNLHKEQKVLKAKNKKIKKQAQKSEKQIKKPNKKKNKNVG